MSLYFLNKSVSITNRSVKALIYRDDGKILLQERDNNKNIPLPKFWNFFGGLIEKNERKLKALERELNEELNCLPGKIKKMNFFWFHGNEWQQSLNFFFPVFFEKNSKMKLREGNKMKWFDIDELINIESTPAIYENFSKIFYFLVNNLNLDSEKFIKKIEKNILRKNNLIKKNDKVFYSKSKNTIIPKQQIYLLKELAVIKKLNLFRVCLHSSDKDRLHEMLMIHTKKNTFGPLKQNKENISYNIIDGSLSVKICNRNKKITKVYKLNSRLATIGNSQIIRIQANKFRIVKSNSPYCIFIETTLGPFKDSDTIWLH